MGRNINMALLVILVVGVIARFTPMLITSNLFSTDVWPLYRDSSILLKEPGTSVWDDKVLDGYNNHWPAVILSTLMVSRITGLDLWIVYGFGVLGVVVLALILSLYVFYDYTLGENKTVIALVLAVFYPSLLVFSSALLKEVYGLPLLVMIWYFIVSRRARGKPWIILASLVSVCLIYAHYFTLFILVGSLASYIIYTYIQYLRNGQDYIDINIVPSILLLVVASISLAVSILSNIEHLPSINMSAPVSILAFYYFAVMILMYGGQLFHSGLRPLKYVVLVVIVLVVVYSFIVLRRVLLIPGMSLPMDNAVLITVLSVVLAFITTILGVHRDSRVKIPVYSWILFIGANTIFIVLYTPLLGSIIHRLLNYLFIPLSIGVSYAAAKNILYRVSSIATIILVLVGSSLLVYSAITYGSPYLFYWSYYDGEINGFETVLVYSPNNMILCGDDKVAYYSMTIRSIDTMTMLRMSISGGPPRSNGIYVVYRGNKLYGYVVNAELYDISGFLEYGRGTDRLFDNGWVEVYGY